MGLLSNLFSKATRQSLFSFWIPTNAPSVSVRNLIKAYAMPWANACIRAIANDVSTIELNLQHKVGTGKNAKWEDVDSHEALDLLTTVNPQATSDDLFFGTDAFVSLTGDSFWYVAYSNGSATISKKPKEIWLLDPTRMAIIRSDGGEIAGYEYTNEKGKKIKLKPWEVIQPGRSDARHGPDQASVDSFGHRSLCLGAQPQLLLQLSPTFHDP
jgi:phage portal protein BeeE